MKNQSMVRMFELVWVKANLNLRSEASVNYLSYAWWVIEPLLHMVTYYLVFGFLLNRGGDNYVAFLLTGIVPWLWFNKAVMHAQGAILGGKQLMNQLYVPKLFFPLTNIVQDSIKQVIVFTILLIFVVLYGIPAHIGWLWLFVLFILQILFIIGCGLLAALIVPFIRDMAFVIPTLMQFMMFCSGTFFDPKNILPQSQEFFFLNPMANLLQQYRNVLLYGLAPDIHELMYIFEISMVLIFIALLCYKKFDHALPRVVLE